jgi:predicted glycosyltransferase involved in capsule biosynthesis
MRIAIAIATRGNDIYAKLLNFICEHVKHYRYNCEVITSTSGFSAEIAQNTLFNYIYTLNVDYVLLVDSDVCPPMDALEKLLLAKADIITAPVWHYCPQTNDIHLNIHYRMIGDDNFERIYQARESGVEEIISTSFACLLLSKKVFDTFNRVGESLVKWSPLLDDSWKGKASDNIFCMKARKLGFQLHVCWDIKGAIHHRTIEICDQTINHLQQNISL